MLKQTDGMSAHIKIGDAQPHTQISISPYILVQYTFPLIEKKYNTNQPVWKPTIVPLKPNGTAELSLTLMTLSKSWNSASPSGNVFPR